MNRGEVRFLSLQDVLDLHGFAIEDQGGDPGIRDMGLLESALAMPRQEFGGELLHPTIPGMAAAYAYHICRNHPFVDGNKRAAFGSMLAFLEDNDWRFDAALGETERMFQDLAAGAVEKSVLTAWIEQNAHPKPSVELRRFFRSLTIEAVSGLAGSVAAGSQAEADASAIEAEAAIPLIGSLLQLSDFRARSGDSQGGDGFRKQAMLLIAMFRVAEDMGYEW